MSITYFLIARGTLYFSTSRDEIHIDAMVQQSFRNWPFDLVVNLSLMYFPHKRPVMWNFDIHFVFNLNTLLMGQSRSRDVTVTKNAWMNELGITNSIGNSMILKFRRSTCRLVFTKQLYNKGRLLYCSSDIAVISCSNTLARPQLCSDQ